MKETIRWVGVILLKDELSEINTTRTFVRYLEWIQVESGLPGFPDDAASITPTSSQSRLVLEQFDLDCLVIRIAALVSFLSL